MNIQESMFERQGFLIYYCKVKVLKAWKQRKYVKKTTSE